MTDLPKSIRVGYRTAKVIEANSDEMLMQNEDGNFREGLFQIRIRAGLSNDRRANTVLHEIIHAAWAIGDLDKKADEEKVVTVLSNILTQVWADNPDFVAFMSDSLNPPDDFPSEKDTIGVVVPIKA